MEKRSVLGKSLKPKNAQYRAQFEVGFLLLFCTNQQWRTCRLSRQRWNNFICPSKSYKRWFIIIHFNSGTHFSYNWSYLLGRGNLENMHGRQWCFTFLSYFSFYTNRRKKIGILATNRWTNEIPKFNTPQAKSGLKAFAAEIVLECGMPEINFAEEGITKYVQTFSN